MQENIELKDSDKIKLKTVAAKEVTHMKDMLVKEGRIIIDNNYNVPRVEREDSENRASLIIKIDDSFKNEIKLFCEVHSIRIRDFWVECVHRILRRYENEN